MSKRKKIFLAAAATALIMFVFLAVIIHKAAQSFDQYATPKESFAALKSNPNDLMAHRELADFYTTQRQYEKAVTELRKIRNLSPDDRFNQLQLGNTLAVAGHKEEAMEIFTQLSKGDDKVASYAKQYISKYSNAASKT